MSGVTLSTSWRREGTSASFALEDSNALALLMTLPSWRISTFLPANVSLRNASIVAAQTETERSVSTSGKSPAYAGHIRREIEALVPDHIEEVLDTLESCRSWLPEILPAQRDRGQFLKELMHLLLEEAEAPRESELRKSDCREPELREMAKKFRKRREQP